MILAREHPETNSTRTATVRGTRELYSGEVRASLRILQGAALALLLIACTNVINLLLARAMSRNLEVSIRLAIGASRHLGLLAAVCFFFLPTERYSDLTERESFLQQLTARLRALPDVEGAAAISTVPLTGADARRPYQVAGMPVREDQWTQYRVATPTYFEVMDIPLLRGRLFDDRDRAGSTQVAIVNVHLARILWRTEDPIGKIFHRAVERLTANPARAVFVGDHPEVDVAGARAAGMQAVWLRDSRVSRGVEGRCRDRRAWRSCLVAWVGTGRLQHLTPQTG